MKWNNRIVGYGTESPDQLMANPRNHRIHPKRQQDALGGSLETLGYISPVIVNKTTGNMVDGHLRVVMALREDQPEIPVIYVELSEAEEAQALLSLDPIAAMAANDSQKVLELIGMVETENENVKNYIQDLQEEHDKESENIEVLLDQAIQLEPAKEYIVVMCENGEEFEKLREIFNLQEVRRGGYRAGSPFDATGVQRVIHADKMLEVLSAYSNPK